jgi:hypothetical protein
LEQLVELNREICKRIRELHRKKLYQELGNFEVGEKVLFKHEGDTISGTIIRINQKSLSIETEKGLWYVDPRFVTKFDLPQIVDNDKIQLLLNTQDTQKIHKNHLFL